jgi:hypothetical protein
MLTEDEAYAVRGALGVLFEGGWQRRLSVAQRRPYR